MQVSKIVLSLTAVAAFAAASASFAAMPTSADNAAQAAVQSQTQTQAQTQNWTPAQQNASSKITRAQVRQELVDAEHNGQLDALRSLYRGS